MKIHLATYAHTEMHSPRPMFDEGFDSRARRLYVAGFLYSALTLVGLVWRWYLGNGVIFTYPAPWLRANTWTSTAMSMAGGIFVAWITVRSTRWLVRSTIWARRLQAEFHNLLGPVRSAEIAFFAVTSGIAEEIFFRGALTPAVGIVLSSVIFGAVHIGPSRAFWPWSVWAGVLGCVFACLFRASGSLVGPIVAHIIINYENMHAIVAPKPSNDAALPG